MLKLKNLIITSWGLRDYVLFFLIISSILISIFLIPQNIKSSFILYTETPSVLSIFLSNFTHTDVNHLKANIVTYYFIAFLIFNVETKKNIFYRASPFIFIVLPIFSSLLIIYLLPNLKTVQGFSAIVSGLFGYFLYSVCNYIRNIYKVKITSSFFWFLLMINFMILIIFNGWFHLLIPVTAALLFFSYQSRTDIKNISRKIKLKEREVLKLKGFEKYYRMYLFIFSLLALFYLPSLIPANVIMGTSVINTPAHYFGYLFGVMIPLFIGKFTKKMERKN